MEIEADNNGDADHAQDNIDVGSGGGEPYKGLDGDLYYKKAGRAYRQESHERVGFLASKVRFKLCQNGVYCTMAECDMPSKLRCR